MEGLSSCGLLCLNQATRSVSCSLGDFDCICSNAQFMVDAQACGIQNCSIKDNLRSMRYLYDTCDYPVVVDNKIYPVVAIGGGMMSTLAVSLRIAGRLIGSRLGLDDIAILISQVVVLAITIVAILLNCIGLGKDMWFLSFHDITRIIHICFCFEGLYIASITLTKVSMLLLFLRLFPDENFRRATYFVLAFTTCWGTATIFALIFACKPISYFWHMWDGEHEGKCISHVPIIWTHSIINISLDVVIIGLPVTTLAKMNLPLGKKIGVCSMFAVGILVTAFSIFRFTASLSMAMTRNITKTFTPMGTWSLVEVYLATISVCMPGIRAFFNYTYHRLQPKWFGYSSSGRSPGGSNNENGGANANLNEFIPAPREVTSGTFQSANREQGEFIRLQEMHVFKT
ncbi:hypothetical protein BJY00DRAFT_319763 [Aspergillus carlsbadensis]|nr:hypothetical protein BJY00DRAFT_319763 [Aspergillus carlsbadensis]